MHFWAYLNCYTYFVTNHICIYGDQWYNTRQCFGAHRKVASRIIGITFSAHSPENSNKIITLAPGKPPVPLQRVSDVHDARRVHLPAQPGAAAAALAGPRLRRHLHAGRRLHDRRQGRLLLPPVPRDDPCQGSGMYIPTYAPISVTRRFCKIDPKNIKNYFCQPGKNLCRYWI
jgi:hypothetical protein